MGTCWGRPTLPGSAQQTQRKRTPPCTNTKRKARPSAAGAACVSRRLPHSGFLGGFFVFVFFFPLPFPWGLVFFLGIEGRPAIVLRFSFQNQRGVRSRRGAVSAGSAGCVRPSLLGARRSLEEPAAESSQIRGNAVTSARLLRGKGSALSFRPVHVLNSFRQRAALPPRTVRCEKAQILLLCRASKRFYGATVK